MTNIEAILAEFDKLKFGAIYDLTENIDGRISSRAKHVVRSFIESTLTSFEKEIREDDRELLEAISKIDRLVSSDPGFEADLLFNSVKSKSIDQRVARDWAEIIVQTYLITHKLLHSCCGGEKANKRLKSLSTKEE